MTDLLITKDHLTLADRFLATRSLTESLASPLSAEDQTVQSMPDVSPTKWHRAHTTWFFETFLLQTGLKGYRCFHPDFGFLFNSYYEGVGAVSAPPPGPAVASGVDEIGEYRAPRGPGHGIAARRSVQPAGGRADRARDPARAAAPGALLMDIKHVLSRNPLFPAYDAVRLPTPGTAGEGTWTGHDDGTYEIGHFGPGFSFDNSYPATPSTRGVRPRRSTGDLRPVAGVHGRRGLPPAGAVAVGRLGGGTGRGVGGTSLLVGDRPTVARFTLGGSVPVNPAQPVCHLSYYEADAFARWAGCRLPTEAEWEVAAAGTPVAGYFLDQTKLHPTPSARPSPKPGLYGDVWQWTYHAAYSPYPSF